MAPEIYRKRAYDSKVDIWAIGVIAHILLSGVAPFPGHNKDQIGPQVISKRLDTTLFERYYQKGKYVRDFLNKCL